MQVRYPDCPHFIESEAQESEITCSRSHRAENGTEEI